MKWMEIKQVIMKARYMIGGLILEHIPQELEASRFIFHLEDHTFWHGLTTGICLGMRILGVCFFAYGITYYEKTRLYKTGEGTG